MIKYVESRGGWNSISADKRDKLFARAKELEANAKQLPKRPAKKNPLGQSSPGETPGSSTSTPTPSLIPPQSPRINFENKSREEIKAYIESQGEWNSISAANQKEISTHMDNLIKQDISVMSREELNEYA